MTATTGSRLSGSGLRLGMELGIVIVARPQGVRQSPQIHLGHSLTIDANTTTIADDGTANSTAQ